MAKWFQRLRASLTRKQFEGWKQQVYREVESGEHPPALTQMFVRWMELETEKLFIEGGMKAVEEARLRWFDSQSLLPYIQMAEAGLENLMVERVFLNIDTLGSLLYFIENNEVKKCLYLGGNKIYMPGEERIVDKAITPFYVRRGCIEGFLERK